jgi:hypothetical protein
MHAFVQKTEVMREEEQVLQFMVGRTGAVELSGELAIGRLARSFRDTSHHIRCTTQQVENQPELFALGHLFRDLVNPQNQLMCSLPHRQLLEVLHSNTLTADSSQAESRQFISSHHFQYGLELAGMAVLLRPGAKVRYWPSHA